MLNKTQKVYAVVGSGITFHNLPEKVIDVIKEELTFSNPTYYAVKRFSKWGSTNVPQHLRYYKERNGTISVPIGFDTRQVDDVERVIDERVFPEAIGEVPEFVMELRDTQKEAFEAYISKNDSTLPTFSCVQLPTGKGKSILGLYIAWYLKCKTLIVVHKDDLVTGWLKDIAQAFDDRVNCGIIKAKKKNVGDFLTIATVQTLARMSEEEREVLYSSFGLVIQDECFEPDTEILTEKGFVKFSELATTTKVAQVHNNGEVDFVVPTRLIKNSYKGEMVKLSLKSGCEVLMTPHHNQVRWLKEDVHISNSTAKSVKFKKGSVVSTFAEDLCYNPNKLFRLSGEGRGERNTLSPIDQLAIALQADGVIQRVNKDDTTSWTIHLTRQRKINRWVELIEKLPFKCSEIKPKEGSKRWYIRVPSTITKILSDYFGNVDSFSFRYAREFINEIVNWDGSISSGTPYYSCKYKENVDFVCSVAVLGSYSAYQSKQVDCRYEGKSFPIHRLFLKDSELSPLQGMKKSFEKYNGDVYCVEVPTHKILVRTPDRGDGKQFVFVSGNCHHAPSSSFSLVANFKSRYRLGLTATPERGDGLTQLIHLYYGGFAFKYKYERNDKDILPVRVIKKEAPIYCDPICSKIKVKDKAKYVLKDLFAPESKKLSEDERRFSRIDFKARPPISFLTFDDIVVKASIHSYTRDIVEEFQKGHSCVVFFTQKEHCRLLYNSLTARVGEENVSLYYGDTADNNSVLEKAESKRKHITIATYAKATEGTNCKQWEVAFFASSMNSAKNVEQALGRIRRSKEGKLNPVLVYDYRYTNCVLLSNHGHNRDQRYRNLQCITDESNSRATSPFTRGFKTI